MTARRVPYFNLQSDLFYSWGCNFDAAEHGVLAVSMHCHISDCCMHACMQAFYMQKHEHTVRLLLKLSCLLPHAEVSRSGICQSHELACLMCEAQCNSFAYYTAHGLMQVGQKSTELLSASAQVASCLSQMQSLVSKTAALTEQLFTTQQQLTGEQAQSQRLSYQLASTQAQCR